MLIADKANVIASARDIGNIGAGCIPYIAARIAFDTLQTMSEVAKRESMAYSVFNDGFYFAIEGTSSRNAEKLGWKIGNYHRKNK